MVELIIGQEIELPDDVQGKVERIIAQDSADSIACSLCELIEELDYLILGEEYWNLAWSVALAGSDDSIYLAMRRVITRALDEDDAARALDKGAAVLPERARGIYSALE